MAQVLPYVVVVCALVCLRSYLPRPLFERVAPYVAGLAVLWVVSLLVLGLVWARRRRG